MPSSSEQAAWRSDQITKSEFFHQKLHEWGLLEVARQIDQVRGETLPWNCEQLGIAQEAWDKIIHRGIKPVVIFAHPHVLMSVPHAVGYYRMLAMVSLKSMSRVGLPTSRYEGQEGFPDELAARAIAQHLNKIISLLVKADAQVEAREFDLWRAMTAGAQAQGSWGNAKGERVELVVKGVLRRRLRERIWTSGETADDNRIMLVDGREFVFADEPDVGVYRGSMVEAVIEIKGGIDTAAVLERTGAAIKSFSRAKEENPKSTTILILQGVSVTPQAVTDLATNRNVVNHWFTVEDILENAEKQEELFRLLAI